MTLLNIGSVSWFKGAVYGLLLAGMYWYALAYLFLKDWTRDDYSYGYIIPFVVLYLIWDRRERLTALPSRVSRFGFLLVGVALCLFWVGELGGEYFSLYISLWLMIVGLCCLHLGVDKLKEMAFPFVIMLTMFPFPNFLYTKISWQLKLVSSQLGVTLMQAFGMSAFREGNVIDLGFTQLQVVDACSGLRYLIPLVVLGLLLSYFYRATFWKRAVVVISTVPISGLGSNFAHSSSVSLVRAASRRDGRDYLTYFALASVLILLLTLIFFSKRVNLVMRVTLYLTPYS